MKFVGAIVTSLSLVGLLSAAEPVVAPPKPMALAPLRPGAIEPTLWLGDWARAAADGITGHLDERTAVHADGWKGVDIKARGAEPKGMGWPLEQCAYWLDGLVRLGHMLNDPVLIQKAKSRLDPVVDGTLRGGPSFIHWMPKDCLKNDFNNWAHSHMGRALVAYYRATGDKRILKALVQVYRDYPLPDFSPRSARFDDNSGLCNLDAMLETYAASGDAAVLKNALSAIGRPGFQQAVDDWRRTEIDSCHGVAFYEYIRVPGLLYPWTGDERLLEATLNVIQWSDRYHGLPLGLTSSEEFLAGIGPTRNVETCNVAAAAWTFHWLLRMTGDASYGDRMEQIFFNAAPAPIARDFQTMCYYQSPNRLSESLPSDEPQWPGAGSYQFTPIGHSTLCCVGNANRILPNYIMHQWMSTPDGGLAATLYGPCRVRATVAGDVPVTIDCQTNYPMEETIRMTVTPARETSFDIYLRKPAWCASPTIDVSGQAVEAAADSHGFLKVARKWKAGDVLTLRLPISVRLLCGRQTRYPAVDYFKDSPRRLAKEKNVRAPYASVFYGPLLFALPIADETPNRVAPGAIWNYALDVDPPKAAEAVQVVHSAMPKHWEWALNAPLRLRVPAVQFDWRPSDLRPLPDAPIASGTPAQIELVPYGCTKFRVSMFPVTQRLWAGKEVN